MLAAVLIAAAGLFPAFQPGPTARPEPLLWETPVSWQAPLRPRPGPAFSPAGGKKVAEARQIARERGPAPAAEYLRECAEPGVTLVRAAFLAEAGALAEAQAEYEKILESGNNTAPRALALDGYKTILRRRIAAGEKSLYQPLVQTLKNEWLNEEALDLLPAVLADPQAPAEVKEFVRRQEPVMALRLGRYDRAVELWSGASPGRSETQWLAQAEGRRGNFAAAAELSLSLASKGRGAEIQAAFEFLTKGGLLAEARDLAARHPRLRRHIDFHWRLGLAALARGDPLAASCFQAVLDTPKAKGRHLGARYFLARSLAAAGLEHEARPIYAELARGTGPDYYRVLARGRLEAAARDSLAGSLSRLLMPGPEGRDQDSLGYHLWITEKGFSREDLVRAARSLGGLEAGPPGWPEETAGELRRFLAGADWWGAFDLLDVHQGAARASGPLWLPSLATVAAWGENYRLAVSLFSRLPGEGPGLKGWSHPLVYAREVRAAHRERGLPPSLLLALIRTESAFQADVMSPSNARGLMQLLPVTAAKVAAALGEPAPGPVDLFDPGLNIRYGSWYLKALIEGFGDESLALAGYNGGPYNIKSLLLAKQGQPLDVFIENLPFEETARYVKRITESRYIYETVYLGRAASPDLARPAPPPNSKLPDF